MKKILPLIFITTLLSAFCFSQTTKDEAIIIKADTSSCELNSLYFDTISSIVSKNGERIFAIFRAGKDETENANESRLIYVKTFLEQVKWKGLDVIYARGEKIDGEGRVEFYVGGKLFLVILAQKNKTPCLTCCGGRFASPQNLIKEKKRKVKNYKK